MALARRSPSRQGFRAQDIVSTLDWFIAAHYNRVMVRHWMYLVVVTVLIGLSGHSTAVVSWPGHGSWGHSPDRRTAEEHADIIHRYVDAQRGRSCDCAAPTAICVTPCERALRGGWRCGTGRSEANAIIRHAINTELPSRTVVELIEQLSNPFEGEYLLYNTEVAAASAAE